MESTASAANQTIRVLLVEDYEPDAIAVRALLAEADKRQFVMEQADSVEKALLRLVDGGLDVVLLDLKLPGSDGLKSLAVVRSSFPSIPVIVVTCMDDRETATKAIGMGAKDFIVKGTFDAQLLARAIVRNASITTSV